jgi:hypothetical protein
MRTAGLDMNAMVNVAEIKSILSQFRYSVQSPHVPSALGLDANGVATNDPGSSVWAMFRIATYVVMERFGEARHIEAVGGDVEGIPWIAMLLGDEPLALLFGMESSEWTAVAGKYKPSSPDEMDADYREMTKH